jgi:hypothetical protein
MSCSPFDLRDYFLKELADPQQRQVESHVRTCQPCREELERLQLTGAALFSLREEEIPQRIAFVSDEVFEPSPWRRALAAFWGSGARLGFASAAMLSTALVVFSLTRPAPVAPVVMPAPVAVNTVSDAGMQARIDSAVARAVAEVDARQEAKTSRLVNQIEAMRQRLLWAADELENSQKRNRVQRIASLNYNPPAEAGDAK